MQRAHFLSMKDAFCQTSDVEGKTESHKYQIDDHKPANRSYDHRRATDSLIQPTGQKSEEANPLMV